MKRYKVTLSKKYSVTVEIEAESADAAADEATSRLWRGEINLDEGTFYDDGDSVVEEITQASD